MSLIKNFNEDTLITDNVDEFYGRFHKNKNFAISILYYSEAPSYYSLVFSVVLNDGSEEVYSFDYLYENKGELLDTTKFSEKDLEKAQKIMDEALQSIEDFENSFDNYEDDYYDDDDDEEDDYEDY